VNVGLCTWAFHRSAAGRRDVAEIGAIAARAGFTALEGAYNPRGVVSLTAPRPDALPVPIASLASLEFHRHSLTSARVEDRAQAQGIIEAMLRCAAAWDIPSISFSPGAAPADDDRTSLLQRLATELAPLTALAAELGVTLALENVPRHVLASRGDMATLLNELPGVGFCLDVGNTLVDPPLSAWCDLLGDRVVKVHLSDGRVSDGRWGPAWLGAGELDWRDVRGFLAESRVRDVFVEVLSDGSTDDDAFTQRIAGSVHEVLAG